VAQSSPWRVNDVVAYERMRDASTTLTALLLARTPQQEPGTALADVMALRCEVLEVDGYDRAAVTELAARIDRRIAELAGDTG
jgi:hypothetical protein